MRSILNRNVSKKINESTRRLRENRNAKNGKEFESLLLVEENVSEIQE